jgi:hypothetical protein
VLASIVGASGADADAERFRFAYRAPPECPDERAFIERVAARIDRNRLALGDDPNAATMSVDVTARDTQSSGRLEFVDGNGEAVVRSVGGRTCDEIVSGLALIAALAIEARTTTQPAIEPQQLAAPNPIAAERPSEPPSSRATPAQLGAGVSGGLDSSSSPGVAFAAGIYGEVAWRAPLRFVRVGARRVAGDGSVGERSATFTRWAARLEACPTSWNLGAHFELPACAAFELGQLAGAGRASHALPNPESDQILWSAVEASAGFRWQPDRWVLEARGGLGFPLVRHKFVFKAPVDPIFDVPAVGWTVAIDVGAHFP